jgi:hypothetical protein
MNIEYFMETPKKLCYFFEKDDRKIELPVSDYISLYNTSQLSVDDFSSKFLELYKISQLSLEELSIYLASPKNYIRNVARLTMDKLNERV